MDIRENITDDPEEPLRAAIDGALAKIFTAMPAQLVKDSDGKTVNLKISTKGRTKNNKGETEYVDYPLLDDVPVHFMGGGGEDKNSVVLTHPISKGKDEKTADEGTALMVSRHMDQWFENGKIQEPLDMRALGMSDAVFIPGLRAKPRALKNISTTEMHARSVDAKHTFAQHPQNGMTMKSVDKDDKEEDPYNKAKKFYSSTVFGNAGIGHLAKNDDTSHTYSLTHTDGHKHSVKNDKHKTTIHPDNGIEHSVENGDHKIKIDSQGITEQTSAAISRTAQSTITDTASQILHGGNTSVSGLLSVAGGLSTGALEVATDEAGGLVQATMGLEVGGVSGGLSFGTLPPNHADDAAAATGGVAVGGVYRTGSALKVRVS